MGGKGAWRWVERETIYLSLHCHHQNDSCIKMGSDESHFNVSVGSDGQSHKTVSTNHNLFDEKGEPKRYRTEVLPLTSLTPYRWATPAHQEERSGDSIFIHGRTLLQQGKRGSALSSECNLPHWIAAAVSRHSPRTERSGSV